MKEILPDIYTWHEFSKEKQLNFNGYLLVWEGEAVLIDPPKMSEKSFALMENLLEKNSNHPLNTILLTNVHHERACDEFRRILGAKIWINEKDSSGLEGAADKTFKDGDRLPCGLVALNIENQKSPGESALFLEKRGVMIVGDALIGKIPGKVNMLPPDKYRDPVLAKKRLNKILDYDFDILLVGDGESILKNAKEAVKIFFEN